MRILGQHNRSELEPDPRRAIERALQWRASDHVGTLPHPKGIFRGTHAWFEAFDFKRAVEQARRVNQAS